VFVCLLFNTCLTFVYCFMFVCLSDFKTLIIKGLNHLTMPNRAVTMPNRAVTMPNRAVTMPNRD